MVKYKHDYNDPTFLIAGLPFYSREIIALYL